MGDNYTCITVAKIYIATVNVHIGLEAPVHFTPYTDGTYCTINLVQYCVTKMEAFSIHAADVVASCVSWPC